VCGYANRIAYIDLTRSKVRFRKLKERFLREYIGGRGLGARYLYDLLPPKIDPLSPLNVLIYAVGPLTGTGAPGSARGAVITKSPKTMTFDDSHAGGFFPSWLKIAGYDALIIMGRASKLSYIYIDFDGKISIKDATHLKGYGVFKTEEVLREEVGDKQAKIASIGPAGENLVKLSGIIVDKHHIHARGGPGAVMGSKNLKAIVVSADTRNPRFEIKDVDGFKEYNNWYVKEKIFSEEYSWAKNGGTPEIVEWSNEAGVFPTRNFQTGVTDNWSLLAVETLKKYRTSKAACYRCSVACRNLTRIKDDKWGEITIDGPEYETIGMVGGATGITDFKAVVALNSLIDDLGLDTISTGNIIGIIMELYEKRLISKNDLNGIEAKWGDAEAAYELIKMIAYRKGFGDIMAEGAREVAVYIGGDAWKYAVETKGLEYPAYDPRGSWSMALAYATADRGADHLRAWSIAEEAFGELDPFTAEGKAEIVKRLQDLNSVKWCMIWCDFIAINYEEMSRYLNLVTGWDTTPEELAFKGERIWNLIRLFNVREGFRREDDYIPYKIAYEPMPSGPAKGKRVSPEDFEKMLDDYYKLRGWNREGIPTRKKLAQLRLGRVAKKYSYPRYHP